jgi:tRNA 2-thiouridine synthesizing protein C
LKDQDTSAIGTKNFSKTFRALEMYDVEKLYVEKESMQARGISEDDLNVPVEVISSEEIGRLMEQHDVILSF